MSFQVGRAIADIGIGGGVPLVEAVTGKGLYLFPERGRLLRGQAVTGRGRPLTASDKACGHAGHRFWLKFTHPLAQFVGL